MRPCGCDWDTRVFGHTLCLPDNPILGAHIPCACTHCDCHCHAKRP